MTNVLWPIDSPVLSGAGCHIPDHPVAVLIHSSLELLSLDFSSLKQICGGSVVMFNNPQLCFLGDFNAFFSDSSQITCLGDRYARDPEQCGNSFFSSLYLPFFLSYSFYLYNSHYLFIKRVISVCLLQLFLYFCMSVCLIVSLHTHTQT